jgi:steroid 5-alpha reductase family enzyme
MILYLEALAAIAFSLSILIAGAWIVQQRTGNSGWVDTISTFSLGLVGAGSALWPLAGSVGWVRRLVRRSQSEGGSRNPPIWWV